MSICSASHPFVSQTLESVLVCGDRAKRVQYASSRRCTLTFRAGWLFAARADGLESIELPELPSPEALRKRAGAHRVTLDV